jgi:hypothetical protein
VGRALIWTVWKNDKGEKRKEKREKRKEKRLGGEGQIGEFEGKTKGGRGRERERG